MGDPHPARKERRSGCCHFQRAHECAPPHRACRAATQEGKALEAAAFHRACARGCACTSSARSRVRFAGAPRGWRSRAPRCPPGADPCGRTRIGQDAPLSLLGPLQNQTSGKKNSGVVVVSSCKKESWWFLTVTGRPGANQILSLFSKNSEKSTEKKVGQEQIQYLILKLFLAVA